MSKVINIDNVKIEKILKKSDKEMNEAIEALTKDPNSITYKDKRSDK